MMYSAKFRDPLEPRLPARCYTGIEEIAAIAGAVGSVASIGMGIAGAAQQSEAQRAAGETAYQNALIRNQQLENQAKQQEAEAKAQQATAQRKAIEERRQSDIAASRARAVMAASGAGVDESLLAGILGTGDYNVKAALYEGDTAAQGLNYQAQLSRYQGQTGITMARRTRAAYDSAAGSTLAYGIAGAATRGLSLAAKYAPDIPGNDVTAAAPPVGGYSLSQLDVNANNYGRLTERVV